MAQTVSVGLHPKVTPSIMGAWAAAGGGGARTMSSSTTVCSGQSALLGDAAVAGGAGVARCRSPVSSSVHSSSVCSPPSESKWTSFDDDDDDDEESEEEPFSERVSSSDQHGLLPLTTDDATSEGDENFDDSLVITSALRNYYTACFDDLLEKTTKKQAEPNGAVRGQDAGVFDFFLKSKLSREELGKVWKLADVNEDGYLNLEEFCVAMHLIVRRVKGQFPIPDALPACLMPPKTPPRNVTPCAHDWTDFESLSERKSSSLPRMRVYNDANNSAPRNESPLKDFTDCLALSADRAKSIACPVACRVSPSDNAVGGEPKYGAVVGRALVISPPQAPKGPPPKPPPRPVVRHVRSASLDLTKSANKKSSTFNAPPPSAPAPQLPIRNYGKKATSELRFCDASVQTDNVRVAAEPTCSSVSVKVVQTASAERDAAERGGGGGDGHAVVTLPNNSAMTVQRDISAAPSTSNVAALKSAAAMESKDWKKRCEDTNRLNALLERELKQLMELRVSLESDLNHLRKQ